MGKWLGIPIVEKVSLPAAGEKLAPRTNGCSVAVWHFEIEEQRQLTGLTVGSSSRC